LDHLLDDALRQALLERDAVEIDAVLTGEGHGSGAREGDE